MAEYKGIKGFKVQYLSADPSDPNIGQTWYNSTSKDLKYTSVTTAGTWATGGNLPTPLAELGGGGTKTAGIAFGGYNPGTSTYQNGTYEYDGSAWTSGGTMIVAKSNMGASGSQTSALSVGGQGYSPNNTTDEYDGTSWAAGTNYPSPNISNTGLTGFVTAAIQIGGYDTVPPHLATVNNYDGTTWTAETALPSGKDRNTATGTQTTAMIVGGRDASAPPYLNVVQAYDGSTWTNLTNYPTGLINVQSSGDSSDAISWGGTSYPGVTQTASNLWDGSTWTSGASTSVAFNQSARGNVGSTSSSTFSAGAGNPSPLVATEEYTGAGAFQTKTITVS